jgi:hypothetical protein
MWLALREKTPTEWQYHSPVSVIRQPSIDGLKIELIATHMAGTLW